VTHRSRGYAVAKQWANFARISADKRVLLPAMIAAPGVFFAGEGK
jgi:hypothetical protein